MALSNKQKNLIEFMVAHPKMPETVCAKECGVPNSTYFSWKQKEEFMKALDKAIKERWKDAQRMAVASMIAQAESGSFNATKYILDNLGYLPNTKIELEGSLHNEIEINITGLNDED